MLVPQSLNASVFYQRQCFMGHGTATDCCCLSFNFEIKYYRDAWAWRTEDAAAAPLIALCEQNYSLLRRFVTFLCRTDRTDRRTAKAAESPRCIREYLGGGSSGAEPQTFLRGNVWSQEHVAQSKGHHGGQQQRGQINWHRLAGSSAHSIQLQSTSSPFVGEGLLWVVTN